MKILYGHNKVYKLDVICLIKPLIKHTLLNLYNRINYLN